MKLLLTVVNFITMVLFSALCHNFVVQTTALIIAGSGVFVFIMFNDSDSDDGDDDDE